MNMIGDMIIYVLFSWY